MADTDDVFVLVVDDDEVDAEAVRRAMRDVSVNVVWARGGDEALEWLRGEGAGQRRIVLVDINMPRMTGFELIDAMRADDDLQQTITYVLTSSSREADIADAYRRNAAGYMVKGEMGARMAHLSSLLSAAVSALRFPA